MPGNAVRPENPPTVIAVRMGYGHLRAAAALADHWGTEIIEADRRPFAGPVERLVWSMARRGYHSLSRLSQNGGGRPIWRRALDRLTAIEDPVAGGEPTLPGSVSILDTLVGLGFGRTLGRRLQERPCPAVATFYANAIAAERHSSLPVVCVVTDSFVHRVWVPRHPAASRISYCVPTAGTADCLVGYGVQRDRVQVTGFPLPPELVGANGCAVLEANLDSRLHRLRSSTSRNFSGQPLRLTVAVGGAGAHAGHARDLVRELTGALRSGRLRLTLVSGTHRWVARNFERWKDRAIGRGVPSEAVEILIEGDFAAYSRRFNRRLADTDILWTKPSEMVFFAALGLPLVLEAPVGDHERHNRGLVVGAGAAVDRPSRGEFADWLDHRLRSGTFVEAAAAGRQRLSACGTLNIASFCSTELYDGFTRG